MGLCGLQEYVQGMLLGGIICRTKSLLGVRSRSIQSYEVSDPRIQTERLSNLGFTRACRISDESCTDLRSNEPSVIPP